MKVNYAKEIAYILENFEHLYKNVGENALKELKETLEYLKMETKFAIIQETLTNSEKVKSDIQTTIEKLNEKIETLNKQKEELEKEIVENKKETDVEEYQKAEIQDDVSEKFQKIVEEAKKEEFEKEQNEIKSNKDKEKAEKIAKNNKEINGINTIIKEFEEYIEKIQEPKELIQKMFKANGMTDELQEARQSIINACAVAMSESYDETEHFGGKPVFDLEYIRDYRGYIVRHYETNEENATKLIELLRDPNLLRDLKMYYNMEKNEQICEEEKKKAEEKLELCNFTRKAIENSRLEDVEEYVTNLENGIAEILNISKTDLPSNDNKFIRFINKLPFRKKAIERKQMMEKKQKEDEAIKKYVKMIKNNEERKTEDKEYCAAYKVFSAAKDKVVKEKGEDLVRNVTNSGRILHLLDNKEKLFEVCELIQFNKEKPQERNDVIESILAQKERESQETITEMSMRINNLKGRDDGKYFSPEVRKLVEEKTYDLSDIERIEEKYIKSSNRFGSPRITPYVASLVLETVLKSKDMEADEKNELANITPEDIKEWKKEAEEMEAKIGEILRKRVSSLEKEEDER